MSAAALRVCASRAREPLTFVSDEVSAQHDEQAEQDEDDDGHHPSDHGVVHARGGRHGGGVWGETATRGSKKRRSKERMCSGGVAE